ncbi:MAG: oligosaccharide flippase family protein, partial [Acidobacteria bacterium]|nr:oligosaccharide flippase family protein [Acidobacteriota bacterium]
MSGVILQQIKDLARQSAVYALADSFGPLLSLLLLPVLTRRLTPADYGDLALLLLFGVATKILFRLGLDAGFFRIYYDQPGEREKQVFTTTLLVASGFVCTLLLAITYLLSDSIALGLLGQPRGDWIMLVAGDTFFNAFSFIPMSLFRIRGRPGFFLAATLLRNGANVALKLGLVLAGWGVAGVLWADLASSAV